MDCSVGEDEDVARTEVGSFPATREPERGVLRNLRMRSGGGDEFIPLLNLPGVLREPAAAHHLLLLQVTLTIRPLEHFRH